MNPGASHREAERLSDLIGGIYDCVLEPHRWDATLDDIRQFLNCANGSLYVHDLDTRGIRLFKIVGIEPRWRERMMDYADDVADMFSQVDDALTRSLDRIMVVRRELSDDYLMANRYFLQWAMPQGIDDMIQVTLISEPTRLSLLAMGRHASAGWITDREVRLMRLLAPHMRRAVTVSDLLDMKSIEANSLGSVLDTLAVGILLVAKDGTILHANRAATAMLDRRTPIMAVSGKLAVANRRAGARLRRIIGLAASGHEADIGSLGVGVALRGRSDDVATAHVLPLGRGAVRTRLLPRAVAAVFVASDLQLPMVMLDAFAEAFGLTPAETRLLDRLLRGESIEEASAALNVARTTARTHLARILAKTGAHRQPALLALVHRLAPALRPVRHERPTA